jgi:hypothetical protein
VGLIVRVEIYFIFGASNFLKMSNPFDIIIQKLDRLETVEQMLIEIVTAQSIKQQSKQFPAIGGIDLAVEVTGLKKSTIYKLVSMGKIPCSKRGKLIFMYEDLVIWIKEKANN